MTTPSTRHPSESAHGALVPNLSLHQAIDDLPPDAIAALAPLVKELQSSSDMRNAAMVRGVRALTRIPTTPALLRRAIQASTDFDFLVSLLSDPEVKADLPSADPLASARLRGNIAKAQLLTAEGGCISTKDVKEILGISEQAIDKRRRAGKLIALPTGRTYGFPRWQFSLGSTISGLETVLQQLTRQIHDPWMQAAWMLNSQTRLGGESPLAKLRQGNLAEVLQAAETYGEQGAT
jgi:hypothetical protein